MAGDKFNRIRFEKKVTWQDLGFHALDSIDFQTFIEPNGLADTFLHNQIHSEYFGEGASGF